ncbi:hypothetical protein C7999DRAFT_32071 [Corynascus novoguineensis]|uniref:Uncharacterized protein n=1 Tax=Corynascus novoguineensis TaxID=1126955 RepID=A0AAN7CUK3_9PEZI|nr:hypothetical protein C7999DRAFT_32071 [Corynascus novoguineensis]
MRLTNALLSLVAGLTACVEASARAGTYQIMFLWNAYQIEIETFGPGNTVTAKNCNHVGAARELPTVTTAEHLKAIGYNSVLDPIKLYPGVYTRGGQLPNLENLLENSFEAVQEARRVTTNPAGIDRFLSLAGESLDSCIDMRIADQSDNLNNDFMNGMRYYRYNNFQIEYRDPKPRLPNGDTYDLIDISKTLKNENNQAMLQGWGNFDDFIKNYVAGYDDLPGNPKKHAAAITALQEFSMKLQFPVDSC